MERTSAVPAQANKEGKINEEPRIVIARLTLLILLRVNERKGFENTNL